MQKQYYLYDENGFYIEPIDLDVNEFPAETSEQVTESQIPPNATDIRPPNGFKMKFNPQTQAWSEGMPQDEINKFNESIVAEFGNVPNETQLLGQYITDLEISDIIQGQQITDLELKILVMEAN